MNPKFLIQQVQWAKIYFVDAVFTDEKVKTLCKNYVNAQTKFAEMLVDNSIEFNQYITDGVANLYKTGKVK